MEYLEYPTFLPMNLLPPSASFVFKLDDDCEEHVTLFHETKKKWQGGIDSTENPKEKHMYAVPCAGETCILKTQTLFNKNRPK